jgi:hypothetical protein
MDFTTRRRSDRRLPGHGRAAESRTIDFVPERADEI